MGVILFFGILLFAVFVSVLIVSFRNKKTIAHSVNPMRGKGTVCYHPIGFFKTPYSVATGAPRQGILMPDVEAVIQLDAQYASGLRYLDKFEYIIVLYHLSNIEKWNPEVFPPGSGHRFGLFATRSPKRPNPIGFSLIRLKSIDFEKSLLCVEGIDAFDGTPVLDIKPWLPSVDTVKSEVNSRIEVELGHHDEVFIKDREMFT